jgi:uncharacterized protein (TIGR03437 family)
MSCPKAAGEWLILLVFLTPRANSQAISSQSLNGNYFFRQVSLGSDAAGNLTDPRSIIGLITFDGKEHFTFAAQMASSGLANSVRGSGTYSVDPAGLVSLSSPVRAGETVNARYGPEAVIGSSTESTSTTFDVFVAIPAPATPTTAGSLSGAYWAVTLEFPGGSMTNARNAIFNLNADGKGTFQTVNVNGHAANISAGTPTTQPVTGAIYTAASDGTITASFGTASPSALLSGSRTIYVSNDGNVLLGGSAASYDILIGVKATSAVTNASWSGRFWGAGLRHDATSATSFVGSAVQGGVGKLIWTRRLKALGAGNVDFTGVNSYSLNANGSGTAELAQVALGAGGAFIGSEISPNDAAGYEIYFGAPMAAVSGSGLWINPQGVVSPASFSPAGNPISPGSFVRIYGNGFATTSQTGAAPYSTVLNGVTVLINNAPAPVWAVTPSTVDFIVPWAAQGPTATVVVQRGGTNSNTVTVPLAATAPAIFSVPQSGSGPAVIQHADYSSVTADHPVVGGETVILYVTGMGAVSPPVADGFGSDFNPNNNTLVQPTVLIGGVPGTVQFSGLTAYPGLYQINVTVPPIPPGITSVPPSLPLAISTPSAYHDQVDMLVQP